MAATPGTPPAGRRTRFQSAEKLTVDGKVGANTWARLRTERYLPAAAGGSKV
ncbi:peptidoglycan-binding domain-containing protein [Streptomyces sp. MB09-01]|uniref:peptidoglycan-binding domain-containing protein n=1 Tax=Streptomyces sp. MB09-01 TaxID=3028666 RepID=UPI003A5BD5F8